MTHYRAQNHEGYTLRGAWIEQCRREKIRRIKEWAMTGLLTVSALYFFVHVVVAVAKGWLAW